MKGFIYSCIGSNSPENREHLEKLGYIDVLEGIDYKPSLILTISGSYSNLSSDYFEEYTDCTNAINCIGNPALFQAITAIRKGSDMYQWFVSDEDIFTKDGDDIVVSKGDFILSKEVDFLCKHQDYPREAHKATIAELQEHFK